MQSWARAGTCGAMVLISGLAAANPVHDQLAALSEGQRREILQRMLQREGERCGQVTAAYFQGKSSDGTAFWSVACRPGKDWQIAFAGRNGQDIRRVDCEMIKKLKAPACFAQFK